MIVIFLFDPRRTLKIATGFFNVYSMALLQYWKNRVVAHENEWIENLKQVTKLGTPLRIIFYSWLS